MKIAVSGAHSVGKTTLVQHIAERWGLPSIGERARYLLETKYPFSEVENDLVTFCEFQTEILESQIEMESRLDSFVVDRPLIDSYAYVFERFSKERRIEDSYAERYFNQVLRHSIKLPYDVIFWIHPNRQLIQSDGNRNISFPYILNLNYVLGWHYRGGAFIEIPVIEIYTNSFPARQHQVDNYIQFSLKGESK